MKNDPAEETSFLRSVRIQWSAISPAVLAGVRFGPDVFADALVPLSRCRSCAALEFSRSPGIVDLTSCGAQGPGVFVRVGLATASISAVTARESRCPGIAEQPRSIAKPRRDAGKRALRHETLANGYRFAKRQGKPIFATPRKPA